MTEINKRNFDDKLTLLFSAIREADFISIDTNAEVTGFLRIDESFNSTYLSGHDWYDAIVAKQRRKSTLDFGVTTFKHKDHEAREGTKAELNVKSFFVPMIFADVEEHDDCFHDPDENGEEMLEIDGFGMEFVLASDLDLNLSLYYGTPFMNADQIQRAQWFMRKHPEFMTLDFSATNGDLDPDYFPKVIKKVSEQDISEIVERLRGIAKFFDVVAETKVPVVGHNLLLKLILLYKQFVEYLPTEFPTFVDKLQRVIPQFYDTKYIAWDLKNRLDKTEGDSSEGKDLKSYVQSHGLFDLFRSLKKEEIVNFDLEENSAKAYNEEINALMGSDEKLELDGSGLCQTSGFDSFVSGMVFAKLIVLNMQSEDINADLKLNNAFFEAHTNQWKNKFYFPDEIKEFTEPLLKCV